MAQAHLDQLQALPRPGSIGWRYLGETINYLLAARALLLQVAHPVVGAGVIEHSNFRQDPWGRLIRTVVSTARFAYGGPVGAPAEGARLAQLHQSIRGIDAHGRPYRALDPAAYAWVHLTLIDTVVEAFSRFARPFEAAQLESLYREWRAVGHALQVADDEMPPTWAAFRAYFDQMIPRLEANQAVADVIEITAHPKAPRRLAAWLPAPAWSAVADPAGRLQILLTAGTLPVALRERFGLAWTDADERHLERVAERVRRARQATPRPLRYAPPANLYMARAWLRRAAQTTSRSTLMLPRLAPSCIAPSCTAPSCTAPSCTVGVGRPR